MKKNLRNALLLAIFLTSLQSYAVAKEAKVKKITYESFEKAVPATWKSVGEGEVALSKKHYKSGSQCLSWNWKTSRDAVEISFTQEIKPGRGINSFGLWVYNEKPVSAPMHVEFMQGDQVVGHCWFWMDYRGWSLLEGSYKTMGLTGKRVNKVRLNTPMGVNVGNLSFDVVDFKLRKNSHSSYQRLEIYTAELPKDRALATLGFSSKYPSRNRPHLAGKAKLTDQVKLDMQTLEKRILPATRPPGERKGKGLAADTVQKLRDQMKDYKILRNDEGVLTGSPIDQESTLPPVDAISFWTYLKFCEQVQGHYFKAKDPKIVAELKQMFIDVSAHLVDQGWREGTRYIAQLNYPPENGSCFLKMRDVLKEADPSLAREIGLMLAWHRGCQNTGNYMSEQPYASMDGLGFWSNGLMYYLLLLPDETERMQRLHIARRAYELMLLDHRTIGPDGCAYHHGMHHLAYANYNMPRFIRTLQQLKGTSFSIGKEARERLRNFIKAVVMTTFEGKQAYNITGRAGASIGVRIIPLAVQVASLGSLDGKLEVDMEMAGIAYAEIINKGDQYKYWSNRSPMKELIEKGLKPIHLKGHHNLNGAAVAVHRQPGWIVTLGGRSKYWRSLEIYGWTQTNNYGLLTRDGSVVISETGINPIDQNGWNWAHIPGATARSLNSRELFRGYSLNSNHSAVAGGTDMGQDGIWGNTLSSYRLSFKKSVFCFGNRITVLTSDIQGKEGKPTTTTLFQNKLGNAKEQITLDDGAGLKLPSAMDIKLSNKDQQARWIMDNRGNGYLIPADNPSLHLTCRKQTWTYLQKKYLKSPENDPLSPSMQAYRSFGKVQKSREIRVAGLEKLYKPTEGEYALGYFQHGNTPKDAKCAYTLVAKTDAVSMKELSKNSPIEILQQDKSVHAILDVASGVTGYILFDANENITAKGLLRSTNQPAFIMMKPKGETLEISAVRPKYREEESELKLVLDGHWESSAAPNPAIVISHKGGSTHLTLNPYVYMALKFTLKATSSN